MLSGRKKVTVVTVMVVCVFAMGRCSAGDRGTDAPNTESVDSPRPAKTVIEYKTKKITVTKTETPASCIKALREMTAITDASSRLANVGVPQLDLMSEAHQAIAGKDWAKLVDLQEDQMKLNHGTLGDVASLELDLLPVMKKHAKVCRDSAK